jgi:hypothetical protein
MVEGLLDVCGVCVPMPLVDCNLLPIEAVSPD